MSGEITSCAHLPNDCALENYEHKEGEKAVIPVFIEHPQCYAEDLEDEERRGSMLGEQRAEGRNWDIELILSIHRLEGWKNRGIQSHWLAIISERRACRCWVWE